MKKLTWVLTILVMTIGLLGGCAKNNNEKVENNKLKVATTIDPLTELTEIIGGDKVEITTMVSKGSEPHDFEPSTKDLIELNKSDIFIYNGLELENWIDKVLETIENKNIEIVNASKGITPIEYNEENEVENKHSHEEGHNHGKIDPHVWLSLKDIQIQADNIKNALIKKDKENESFYTSNYNKFIKEVNDLYNEYDSKMNSLSSKDLVTGHAAFGYLCRDFNLNQVSVEDVFGEGEITPQHLKSIVDFCKENNIKTIFMPELVSPKVSETLANEVGAKIESIYSLESNEDGLTYLEAMKSNLQKIYNNLK
ncbi:ABC transporter substrate-binding protein [Clostridium tarantellae]|uniref:ABC transporter substrate-binding protein n=2 Tax=Clostridium tarantellae TaxID=39493 RepID=A0A6I1MNG7_9CLOT|nr:ABC transporter substrate-binding protein [Clostridium tarantellae]